METDVTLPELCALNVADVVEATHEVAGYGLIVHTLTPDRGEHPIRMTFDPWDAVHEWLLDSERFFKRLDTYSRADEPIFRAEYQARGVSGRTRLTVPMLTQILAHTAALVEVDVRPWLARGLEEKKAANE